MMTKLDIHAGAWRFLRQHRADDYRAIYERKTPAARKQLVPATTSRQFATAAEILDRMNAGNKGILLADDVGVGKTAVAALIALVFAGKQKRVRILAPNDTMVRRWRQELEAHADPVAAFASHLDLEQVLRRTRHHVQRLRAGSIAVTTHGRAGPLSCDLLIIDEAHRTRSEKSNLAVAIKQSHTDINRMLVLTATPFSIDPLDLARLLAWVGGGEAKRPIKKYAKALADLWRGHNAGSPAVLAEELVTAATGAVNAIKPYVIRHGVCDLPVEEQQHFGTLDTAWGHTLQEPPPDLLEAMLRTDRALGLGRKNGAWRMKRTNDPRHHVGAHKLQKDLDEIIAFDGDEDSEHEHARAHAQAARKLLRGNGRHAKIAATVDQVRAIVAENEKVLVFCDHHATAAELAYALAEDLRWPSTTDGPHKHLWRSAWGEIFADERTAAEGETQRLCALERYQTWLCSHGMRAQVQSWISPAGNIGAPELARLLRTQPARRLPGICDTIATHARELYEQMTDAESGSTRAILANPGSRGLPGRDPARVAAVCNPLDPDKLPRFLFPKQPDAVLTVFNSPFGPDVLVATDKLSEGVDLHYFCRHLIHHELDPSPVRTVQRNGRIRRVNCWAARSGQPIRIAYPALKDTRDEKLVEIMRHRLLQFDLLLGGVRGKIDPDAEVAAPSTTEEILEHAKSKKLGALRLCLDLDFRRTETDLDDG